MKHEVRIQIETEPCRYRYATAHVESIYTNTEEHEYMLEMECALDDAGNYCSVPQGFWRKVEEHLWIEFARTPWPRSCRSFPEISMISLLLNEQKPLSKYPSL